MNSRDAVIWSLLVLGMSGCGEDVGPKPLEVKDAGALRSALGSAAPGQEIVLEAGRYEGSFAVPAGVRLRGQRGTVVATETGGGTLIGNGRLCVLCLESSEGAVPTEVRSVVVKSSGLGVVARGGGEVVLEDVRVDATLGLGLVAEGVKLDLRTVSLNGPIQNEEELGALEGGLEADRTAVIGALVVESEFTFSAVNIRYFAGYGAVFYESTGQWTGGEVKGNVGTGVLAEVSAVELGGMEVTQGLRGPQEGDLALAYGVVAASSRLVTSGVEVRGVDGVGVLQDGGVGEHTDLRVDGSTFAGIWVQDALEGPEGPVFSVSGESHVGSSLGLGLYLREVGDVVLSDLRVTETGRRLQLDEGLGVSEVGDGLQISSARGRVELTGVRLEDNQRVGLLIDQAVPGGVYAVQDVSVVGIDDGEAYGAIIQNAEGVERSEISVEPATVAARDEEARLAGVELVLTPKFDRVQSVRGAVMEVVDGSGGLREGVVIDASGDLVVQEP